MRFEEEFPQLVMKCEELNKNQTEHGYPLLYWEGTLFKVIEETCLDKQRVKEAIKKVLKNAACDEVEWQDLRWMFSELEEELGLEEEE